MKSGQSWCCVRAVLLQTSAPRAQSRAIIKESRATSCFKGSHIGFSKKSVILQGSAKTARAEQEETEEEQEEASKPASLSAEEEEQQEEERVLLYEGRRGPAGGEKLSHGRDSDLYLK